MYAKFAAAIVCIALCSLNVIAAVKRTPIRTTLEGSSRTTVEMMPSPNSGVHWMSAVIFLAGFACFLGWGISDYNNAVDTVEASDNLNDSSNQLSDADVKATDVQPYSPLLSPPAASLGYPNEFLGKNVVQFSPRSTISKLEHSPDVQMSGYQVNNQAGMLSPQEFYAQLQDEDFWSDNNSQANNNHLTS
ncbi:hypothetical protein DP113_33020 (plasmid) [Brasilonema octagenarum UFV-E1]|uniref:Uncharacterized protein n=2 Tax=Brasilonema TaxID=383614 RepID=A0A856MPT1_9CYAN|nr:MULTISPECIES: hypothetical protein [Brasilonema]NMF65729.1 hypothetical protein [Brasilonema octagenarum UFV-OR1]QDL12572.1 hypothetical protein DP114_32920 [Brasilonema sennae CENA114]QDL18966.1 hypothetical protein DP113_33020 [Brasilonema octagenarum UFV-E1]